MEVKRVALIFFHDVIEPITEIRDMGDMGWVSLFIDLFL